MKIKFYLFCNFINLLGSVEDFELCMMYLKVIVTAIPKENQLLLLRILNLLFQMAIDETAPAQVDDLGDGLFSLLFFLKQYYNIYIPPF